MEYAAKSYRKSRGYDRKLPTGTTGAIAELAVCCDLLKRGYYIFRSISQNSPYDIIATKPGQSFKIEIRTGVPNKNGQISFSKHTYHPDDVCDYHAVYVPGSQNVIYDPPLK
jgi:hypothetical protein